MVRRTDYDQLISNLEARRGQEFTDEQRGEIELWSKGRALAQIVGFYGWEVAMEMLSQYVVDATERLVATDPGDEKERNAQHAIAHAASKIVRMFREDVLNAINASQKTPDVVKLGARGGEVPPESLI